MSIPRKEYQNWLEDIEITHKFTNEDGCVCNEIIFTAKNGNKLSLTLFDVKPLSEDTLADEYFQAVEERLAAIPPGFPMVYSIMYTPKAAKRSHLE